MKTPLVVVGAGGFGRETLDVIEAMNTATVDPYDLLGVLDDDPSAINLDRLDARGVAYLGRTEDWIAAGRAADYVVGVGRPSTRRMLAASFDVAGLQPATLVHPSAVFGSAVVIGAGSVVCAGVTVSTNVRLGRQVHLNPSVTVGHDAVLGAFVSVNPAATVSGGCAVGDGVLLGAASVILQGLSIGPNAVVGAAACVVRDVPAAAVVKGVPAR